MQPREASEARAKVAGDPMPSDQEVGPPSRSYLLSESTDPSYDAATSPGPHQWPHGHNVGSREADNAIAVSPKYFQIKGGARRNLSARGQGVSRSQRSSARRKYGARESLGPIPMSTER